MARRERLLRNILRSALRLTGRPGARASVARIVIKMAPRIASRTGSAGLCWRMLRHSGRLTRRGVSAAAGSPASPRGLPSSALWKRLVLLIAVVVAVFRSEGAWGCSSPVRRSCGPHGGWNSAGWSGDGCCGLGWCNLRNIQASTTCLRGRSMTPGSCWGRCPC